MGEGRIRGASAAQGVGQDLVESAVLEHIQGNALAADELPDQELLNVQQTAADLLQIGFAQRFAARGLGLVGVKGKHGNLLGVGGHGVNPGIRPCEFMLRAIAGGSCDR